MPFLSPNQQCQSTEGKNITFHGLACPMLTWGFPTLSLTTNSSWLPWGRVAMPLISPLIPVPNVMDTFPNAKSAKCFLFPTCTCIVVAWHWQSRAVYIEVLLRIPGDVVDRPTAYHSGCEMVVLFPICHCFFITNHWLHCTLSCGVVYCNHPCLFVCGVFVTMITQNCVHRSSPNWVCR